MDRVPTLILTVGIPGSGKSTWAVQEQRERPFQVRIVTRDDIRFALGTRFEDGDEKAVARIAEYAAEEMLDRGYDVIIADTNLSPKVRRRWAQMAKAKGVDLVERAFPIDLDEAIRRVNARADAGGHYVPTTAIQAMHESMQEYMNNEDPNT